MISIKGYFYDGQTSKRHQGRLDVYPDSNLVLLHLYNGDDRPIKEQYAMDELKIESRLGQTEREIVIQEDKLFVSDDHDSIDLLCEHTNHHPFNSLLHKLENHIGLVVVFTLLTIVSIWSTVVYGVPYMAKSIADKLPTVVEEQFGTGLDVLDNSILYPSELDEKTQQELRIFFQPYLEAHPHLKPKVAFRTGVGPNAFALPHGQIVLTDELVEMVENHHELLPVLFHELGHIEHKHLVRRALQDSMVALVILFITGDVESMDIMAGIGALIIDLTHSKEFEREADHYAIKKLAEFNISTDYFVTVMKRFSNYKKDKISEQDNPHYKAITDFLSTHPPTEERIALIKQFDNK